MTKYLLLIITVFSSPAIADEIYPWEERVQYCVRGQSQCVIFGYKPWKGGRVNFETNSRETADRYNELFEEFGVDDLYMGIYRFPTTYSSILNTMPTVTVYFESYEKLVDKIMDTLGQPEIRQDALNCLGSGTTCGMSTAAALGSSGAAWALPIVFCTHAVNTCIEMKNSLKTYNDRIRDQKDVIKEELFEIADEVFDGSFEEFEESLNTNAPSAPTGGGDPSFLCVRRKAAKDFSFKSR